MILAVLRGRLAIFSLMCTFFLATTLWAEKVEDSALQSSSAIQATENQAGDTRAGLFRSRRLAKFSDPPPTPRRNNVEKALIWMEQEGRDRVGNLHFKRFFPLFGGTPTGSGYAFGTRYWNPRLKNTAFDLEALAVSSLRGYQVAGLRLGHVDQPQRKFSSSAHLRFRDYPEEDFFGIGPGSRQSSRSDYRVTDYHIGGGMAYEPLRWLRADVGTAFLRVDVQAGTDERFPDIDALFGDDEVPGLARQPDFHTLESSLLFEYRDEPGNPHTGGMVQLHVGRFEALDESEFDFTRLGAEVRHYWPLGILSRVLALRFATSFDVSDQGHRVPFYLMKTLGGSESLRGFREFRFRDRNQLHLSLEYRWEATQALEGALFSDVGKVFPEASDFGFKGLEAAYGFGLRVKSRSSVIFRIDAARSQEGFRVYFKFAPSF